MNFKKSISYLLVSILLFYNVAYPISFQDDKIVIAVVDFKNTGQDANYDFLEKTIPEAIMTNLAIGGKVEIVERSRLSEALKEMKLGMSGVLDEATAVEVGKAVGAKAILLGSFVSIGNIIRINARLIDVETSKIIKAETVQGGVGEEIFNLMDDLTASIEAQLVGEPEQKDDVVVSDEAQPIDEPEEVVQDQPTPVKTHKTMMMSSSGKPFYKTMMFRVVAGVVVITGIAFAISSSGDDDASVDVTVTIP